ncbi:hypothetical protein [Streptomyces mirabilis]|uniref:hypothetical protein n=1 Tax=Streptomyces mirabilis TaxID=68239 RepID=UPI0036D83DB2
MATMTAPDISAQLEQARREAADLRSKLNQAEGELAQAVEARDYGRADKLKQRAADLRPHVLLAEANAKALQDAASALEEHRRQENAAEIERERQERYEAACAQYAEVERESIAEADRLFSEAKDRIAEARQSLQAALVAEGRAGQARRDTHQAAVEAGLEQPRMYGPAAPNRVRAHIDASELLAGILRTN